MDPVAHTLVGGALAGAGLHRRSPLAALTLVAAANAPDIDVVTVLAGEYGSLAARRGWTHGVLALAVLPVITVGTVLVYDRFVRRRRDPDAAPPDARVLLALAALGVLTHPLLDWLNTYGVRLLSPLSMEWFYGDALFIVDPWVWALLGGALFAGFAYGLRPVIYGVTCLVGATLVVLLTPGVPPAARVAWMTLMAAAVAGRLLLRTDAGEALARGALAVVACYILAMIGASMAAETRIRGVVEAEDGPLRAVMFQPAPADPFGGTFVAETESAYRLGAFRWFGSPRVRPGELLEKRRDPPIVTAAATRRAARDYLVWSRFPYFRSIPGVGETTILVGDARFADEPRAGSLQGVTVTVRR